MHMVGTAPQFRANSSKLNRQPVWWSLWRSGGGGDEITLLSIYFPSTEQTEQNSTSIKIVWEGDTCITDREESLLNIHQTFSLRVLSKSSSKDANTSIYIVQIKKSTISDTDKSDFLIPQWTSSTSNVTGMKIKFYCCLLANKPILIMVHISRCWSIHCILLCFWKCYQQAYHFDFLIFIDVQDV